MTEQEIVKKKRKQRAISKKNGHSKIGNQFPTLAHIVLSNGSRVEIPKLPYNFSELTIYENLRIALEHAGLAISCVNRLEMSSTTRLADSHDLAPIRLNLEDLMNHLYYAIEGWDSPKGQR